MVRNSSSREWTIPLPSLRWTLAIGITSLVMIGGGVLYFTRFQRTQPPAESSRSADVPTINALGRIEPVGEVGCVAKMVGWGSLIFSSLALNDD
jgi:hypothetical protein